MMFALNVLHENYINSDKVSGFIDPEHNFLLLERKEKKKSFILSPQSTANSGATTVFFQPQSFNH